MTGKRIWVNGCFDVLHLGHLKLLQYAKSRGKWLTVGIDSDERVKKLKGSQRPVNDEKSRIEMLKAIRWVDNVLVFDSDKQLEKLVEKYSDLMIIGSEYKDKKVIGSQHSPVEFFDKIDGYSSTNIIKKMEK
tara:strand:- start:260 stop:655 length:396 start_codon:yes stop_codon:yes gene_type:complete